MTKLTTKQIIPFQKAKRKYMDGNTKERSEAVDAVYEQLGTKGRTEAMKLLKLGSEMPHWPLYLLLGVTEVEIKPKED